MSTIPDLRPVRPQVDLVAGQWQEPAIVLGTLADPNTGAALGPQLGTSAEQVEQVLTAADALHRTGELARQPLDVRAALLEDIAAGLTMRADDLAYEDAMSTGNAIRVARSMAGYIGPRVLGSLAQLRQIGEAEVLDADRGVTLLRRPLGPAVVLAPWNAPTFVAVAKLSSALAAGCPVILKPSEWAPGGCQIVAEVIHDAVARQGLPAATFQLVHGGAAVGSQLAADPRVRAISFTGGAPAGRAVAAAAAPHFTSLQLELGGHNPAVVLEDADIELTAAALVDGMTKLNGQWCEAPGKVLVPASKHDELVEALVRHLGEQTVGHCLDEETDVGPLAYELHRSRLQDEVDRLVEAGGTLLTAGSVPGLNGWFFAPSVIVGLPAAASAHELFGPAITVHAVGSIDEALQAADGPETGLAGFVFGTDTDAALDVAARIPAGEIRVNGCKLADLADGSEQSFWNNAGIGGHGPTDMVRFFQGRRTIGIDDPTLPV
jgi:phenylacetaldehyde dehydrogenase